MIRLRLRRRRPDPLVCREFVELVTDYLDGALPPEQRERFEAHLAECEGCTGYLEDMRSIATTLETVPSELVVRASTAPPAGGSSS